MHLDGEIRIVNGPRMRIFFAALMAGLFAFGGIRQDARAEGGWKVLILESLKSNTPVELGTKLRALLETATEGRGLTVFRGMASASQRCESPDCLSALARDAGATHVLHYIATFVDESYSFNLELWDAATSRSLGSDGRDCAICGAEELMDAVANRAARLLDRALAAPSQKNVIAKPVFPPVSPPKAPKTRWRQSLPYVGTGLLLGGIGLGIAGGYYLREDGQSTSEDRLWVRDTHSSGVALLATGAVAFLGGIAFWTWHFLEPDTTVSVGLRSLTFTKTF